MASSNLTVLTKSHKIIAAKKRAKKEQIKEILFDDNARREFLTGFHKRKLEKKEAAKQKAQEREKQERLEARREKRRMLAEQAAKNVADAEAAYGGHVDKDDNDEEWSGLAGPSGAPGKGKGKEKEEEYEYEEQVATVTVVEDFDPDALIHGPSRSQPELVSGTNEESSTEQQKSFSNNVHSHSTSKAKDTRTRGSTDADRTKLRSKSSAKAKDIKYQTNAARKTDRLKQRRRKVEKAERAGGKGSRKSSVGRRKR